MRITRADFFWIAVGAVSVVALVLLHRILLPFVVGAIVAYLLVPLVDRMELWGINRSLTTLSLVLILALVLIVATFVMFPVMVGELRFFLDQFPRYVVRLQSIALDSGGPWLHSIFGEEIHIEQSSAEIASKLGSSWLDAALRSMWAGGLAVLSLISLVVVAPIVSIYMIIDWKRMISTIENWLPPEYISDIHALSQEIHETILGFVRGQSIICICLALFYAIALRIVGLHHAVLLGITAGIISFVPYIGAATGLLLSTCIALVQFWPNWTPVAVVGCIFILGEAVADYVLSPRIIGRRVKLHPVWLIFALSAFGWLFGFVGLLVAVPVTASLRVLLTFAFARSQTRDVSLAVSTGYSEHSATNSIGPTATP
jgi:predicted PurR-regulated permease PerM